MFPLVNIPAKTLNQPFFGILCNFFLGFIGKNRENTQADHHTKQNNQGDKFTLSLQNHGSRSENKGYTIQDQYSFTLAEAYIQESQMKMFMPNS